jgi:hypothetical protein
METPCRQASWGYHPYPSVGAVLRAAPGPVGQQHARNGAATILRRGREEHWPFFAPPPTEVNTEHPCVGGACRRTAGGFARIDRANRQPMGPGTPGHALCSKNLARSAPAERQCRKTRMIPGCYRMESVWEVPLPARRLPTALRNSSLISMTFATSARDYCCAETASDRENAAR